MEHMDDSHPVKMGMKAEVAKLEVQAKKHGKSVPSIGRKVHALNEAKSKFEGTCMGHTDFVQGCAAKADDRARNRIALLEEAAETLSTLRIAAETEEAKLKQAHQAKADKRLQFSQEVLRLIEAKTTELEDEETFGDAFSDGEECPITATEAQRNGFEQAASHANGKLRELSQKVAELESQKQEKGEAGEIAAQEALAKASSALADSAKILSPKCVLSTETVCEAAQPSQLPDYTPGSDERAQNQLRVCGHLYNLLLLWNIGGCQPVTFGELAAHSLAGDETPALLKALLGCQLWDGWFSRCGESPPHHEPIPRQALAFVSLALDKLNEQHQDTMDMRQDAQQSYALMTAESKKRRALP